MSALALPEFQPMRDGSGGFLWTQLTEGMCSRHPQCPSMREGRQVLPRPLKITEKSFKGSFPCTFKNLGKYKDWSKMSGLHCPMLPCVREQWGKSAWFPWTIRVTRWGGCLEPPWKGLHPGGLIWDWGEAGRRQQRDGPLENQRLKGYCSPLPKYTYRTRVLKAVVGIGLPDLTNENTNGHLHLNFR